MIDKSIRTKFDRLLVVLREQKQHDLAERAMLLSVSAENFTIKEQTLKDFIKLAERKMILQDQQNAVDSMLNHEWKKLNVKGSIVKK